MDKFFFFSFLSSLLRRLNTANHTFSVFTEEIASNLLLCYVFLKIIQPLSVCICI